MKKAIFFIASIFTVMAMFSGCGTEESSITKTTAEAMTATAATAAPTTVPPTTAQPTTIAEEDEDYRVENHNYQIRYDENGDPYIIDTEAYRYTNGTDGGSDAGGAH